MARIEVIVSAGAKSSEILGRHGGGWKARVSAAPERGRANAALQELIAKSLGVPRNAVRIVSGETTRHKVVEVDGVAERTAAQRLDAAARRRS
jgi:uncharacterized protein